MTNEQIEKFLSKKLLDKTPVQINFKTRQSIKGIFIKTADYDELRSKNLWRIVGGGSIPEYNKSGDVNLARIFNGVEITRLEAV
jgi:hypothetical protein